MLSDTYTSPLMLLEMLEPKNEGRIWLDVSEFIIEAKDNKN